jgi:hypothetical protein
MSSRAVNVVVQAIGDVGPGRERSLDGIKDFLLPLPDETAKELLRQPELIEPILESLVKLNSILPSLGLGQVEKLVAVRDFGAYSKPRFEIVIASATPLQLENWMRIWDVLSSAIEGTMRARELGGRVFVYLDPCW